jgi:hypothetical protein
VVAMTPNVLPSFGRNKTMEYDVAGVTMETMPSTRSRCPEKTKNVGSIENGTRLPTLSNFLKRLRLHPPRCRRLGDDTSRRDTHHHHNEHPRTPPVYDHHHPPPPPPPPCRRCKNMRSFKPMPHTDTSGLHSHRFCGIP